MKKGITKEEVDLSDVTISSEYDEVYKLTDEVIERMKLDNIPSTPNNYKIYFQKILLEKEDLEFRKSVNQLEIHENNEETKQILKHEQKVSEISKLSKNIIKNIHSIYKKTSYLIKLIEDTKNNNSEDKCNPLFFDKLYNTIKQIESSLKKDMENIKILYSENVKTIKELNENKIFDLHYNVYKKEYFLSKVQQELEATKKYNFDSYIMLVRLDKKTNNILKSASNLEKANKFFSKILLNKFRKDDIIGYVGNGVFGIILSNLNDIEIKNVASKFTNILNNSAMFVDDNYIELHCNIAISKLNGDSYLDILSNGLNLLDKIYGEEKSYFIENLDSI